MGPSDAASNRRVYHGGANGGKLSLFQGLSAPRFQGYSGQGVNGQEWQTTFGCLRRKNES